MYRTRADSATPRRDCRATSGTLWFRVGQTQRTFSVPIVNDSRAEGPETLLVDLLDPATARSFGIPRTAKLTTWGGDQRLDGW